MEMNNRKHSPTLVVEAPLAALMLLFQYIYTATQHVTRTSHSRFEALLRDGKIADVQVVARSPAD
ncbi:hypothetical protein EOA13_23345 [Mesorhizobium sp. M7A.F.Ca.US.011.01.1.1]|uniref:hypothetical protein n=1 Tax=Mesorhizobium sp. M7A.F.Ca.US.011.01.1.1 TaxID=2496741 RepID=UPI000FCB6F19|nr:hypothetical protein [Mesorhizobium sp. M7A.F.Ca.US.011.01.1.1]RUX26450.1 hypothetical protein EOA13_23345 [Mesorhizobium sp. M7A.F.Ca.US.011.01.1.1]